MKEILEKAELHIKEYIDYIQTDMHTLSAYSEIDYGPFISKKISHFAMYHLVSIQDELKDFLIVLAKCLDEASHPDKEANRLSGGITTKKW